jgi:hypothetical protein
VGGGHGVAGPHESGELVASQVVGEVAVAVAGDDHDAAALHPVDRGSPAVWCPGVEAVEQGLGVDDQLQSVRPDHDLPGRGRGQPVAAGDPAAVGEPQIGR